MILQALIFIAIFVWLMACSPFFWKASEDVLEGEAKIIEKVAEDIMGPPAPKASVDLVKKRF